MKICPQCNLRYPDETTFCFVDGATLQSGGDGIVGRTVSGMYLIDRRLAETPWSLLHRGVFRLVDGACTIKLLREPLDEGRRPAFVERVRRARRYAHPNVAEVWSGGVTADGMAYVVGPALDARPLTELMARGPLPVERVVGLLAHLLRGLGRVHDFGGVHGDLRPSNVLVDAAGRALLVDVGLGRSTYRELWDPAPQALAALAHLAPELHQGGARSPEPDESGNEASARGDLYALGVLAHTLLTGAPPVVGASAEELRARLHEAPAERPSAALRNVPEELGWWLDELLQRTPELRSASAHQALADLQQVAERASLAVPPLPQDALGIVPPAPVLAALFGRWEKYVAIFCKMVELGFSTGVPPQTRTALDTIRGKAQDLALVGKEASEIHQALSEVYRRAREGRQRIAEQMVEFTEQVRVVQVDLRPLQLSAVRCGAEAQTFPPKMLELHREAIRWEGRSGFREPYRELAQAYRVLADCLDQWFTLRSEQLRCETEIQERDQQLGQVRAQLDELRTALRIHESNIDAEVEACEQAIGRLVLQLDELEPSLLDMATRLTAPLRAKPELGACFRELQQVSV